MAELISVAGIAITLPGILSASWTVLKAAYDLYGDVDIRRTRIGILLTRCRELVQKLALYFFQNDVDLSDSPSLRHGVRELEETCRTLKTVMEKLEKKNFFWCMVNQDKIDTEIERVSLKISDAFNMFNFAAHLDSAEFRHELQQARVQDQVDLDAKLEDLAANDHRIIDALQDQERAQRRMEDLLIAVVKRVHELGPDSESTPEAKFMLTARTILQRESKSSGGKLDMSDISKDWLISSLEVDFEPADKIGEGSFGRVFKGYWQGTLVAVKQMYVDDARTLSDMDRKMMYKEVRVWTTLHHPNILDLYGASLEATSPFLVMQYCSLGNLREYLVDNPDANRVDMVYDITAGMVYLHGKNVIHGDLKAANILVDDRHNALVTDFGLATTIDGIRSRTLYSSHRDAVQRGTLRWMAPECLDGEPSTKSSDIYSLAITIWEVFSGDIPFAHVTDRLLVSLVVDRQRRPPRPGSISDEAMWELVQRCWHAKPASRPHAREVQASLSSYTTRLQGRGRERLGALAPSQSTPKLSTPSPQPTGLPPNLPRAATEPTAKLTTAASSLSDDRPAQAQVSTGQHLSVRKTGELSSRPPRSETDPTIASSLQSHGATASYAESFLSPRETEELSFESSRDEHKSDSGEELEESPSRPPFSSASTSESSSDHSLGDVPPVMHRGLQPPPFRWPPSRFAPDGSDIPVHPVEYSPPSALSALPASDASEADEDSFIEVVNHALTKFKGFDARRSRTVKLGVASESALTNGKYVIERRVPTPIVTATEAKWLGSGSGEEFYRMRYSAVTCDADDFTDANGWSLHPKNRYRQTEILIAVTYHSEDKISFARTFHGIMLNIRDIVTTKKSKYWRSVAEEGTPGWQKIVVALIFDGLEPMDKSTLDILTVVGVYQDGVMKRRVINEDTVAHVFEYTTQLSIDTTPQLCIPTTEDPKNLVPVQVIPVIKQESRTKVNSHRWAINAIGRMLNPEICVLIDGGTKPASNSIYNLWHAFYADPNLSAFSGEISGKALLGARSLGKGFSNMRSKLNSSLGNAVSVSPGAFTAYRYRSILGRPLRLYFIDDY